MGLHYPLVSSTVAPNNPFGAIGDTSPAGYLLTDTRGPLYASFGWRSGYTSHAHVHEGVDYPVGLGTAIAAVEAGKVVSHGYDQWRGNFILVLWRTASGQAIYCAQHLSGFVSSVGASVAKGAYIARSGASGDVTGPHLHAELRFTTDASASWIYWQGWRALNLTRCLDGHDLATSPMVSPYVPTVTKTIACSGGYMWSAATSASTQLTALPAGTVCTIAGTVTGTGWGFGCNGTYKSGSTWYRATALGKTGYIATGRF